MYCARNGAMAARRTKKPPPPTPPRPTPPLGPLARASTQYLSLAAAGKTVMQKVAHQTWAILQSSDPLPQCLSPFLTSSFSYTACRVISWSIMYARYQILVNMPVLGCVKTTSARRHGIKQDISKCFQKRPRCLASLRTFLPPFSAPPPTSNFLIRPLALSLGGIRKRQRWLRRERGRLSPMLM